MGEAFLVQGGLFDIVNSPNIIQTYFLVSGDGSITISKSIIEGFGFSVNGPYFGSVYGGSNYPVVFTLPVKARGVAYVGSVMSGYTYNPICIAGEQYNSQWHPVDEYNSSVNYLRLGSDGVSVKYYSDRSYTLNLGYIIALL